MQRLKTGLALLGAIALLWAAGSIGLGNICDGPNSDSYEGCAR